MNTHTTTNGPIQLCNEGRSPPPSCWGIVTSLSPAAAAATNAKIDIGPGGASVVVLLVSAAGPMGGRIFMRPSSLGGGRILRRTLSVRLSVCLSVCPSVCPSVPLSLPSVTSFRQPLAARMYFSARTEDRISYGHLGRTDSC